MKNFISLTKILLVCGSDSSADSGKNKKNSNPLLMAFLPYLVLIPVIGQMVGAASASYKLLSASGVQASILQNGSAYAAIGTLVLGITTVLTYFYTSSDITTLLSLPLSSGTIVSAKWTVAMIYSFYMSVLMALPMYIGYGTASGAGWLYWVFTAVITLTLPMTPLIYAGIIDIIMMRIFKRLRSKQAVTILSSVVTILTCLLMVAYSMQPGTENSAGAKVLSSAAGRLIGVFPNLILADRALEDLSAAALLLYLVSVAVMYGIFMLVAHLFYFDSVISMSDQAGSRHQLTARDEQSFASSSGSIRALSRVEWLKVKRSPTYLLNCVIMALMMPCIFLVSLIQSAMHDSDSILTRYLTPRAAEPATLQGMLIMCLIFIYFTGAMVRISSTSISREGQAFYFMKTIPVPYRSQIKAKIFGALPAAWLISAAVPVGMAAVGAFHGMTPLFAVYLLVLSLPAAATESLIQIRWDLRFPNLNWNDENASIRNRSSWISLLVNLLLLALVTVILCVLLYVLHLSNLAACSALLAVQVIILLLVRRGVYSYADRRMLTLGN